MCIRDRGWITVLAYLACGFLSVMVWRQRSEPLLRRFWAFLAVLMLLMAINKQLDLQTALTQTGRCLAIAQGWIAYKRLVQLLFILSMIAAMVFALRRGRQVMLPYLPSHRLALAGTVFVAGYVLIRATSFHFIDIIGGTMMFGLSMNFFLENVGLLLIAVNAAGLLTGRIPVDPPVEPLIDNPVFSQSGFFPQPPEPGVMPDPEVNPESVSYTHLTQPTKRIV